MNREEFDCLGKDEENSGISIKRDMPYTEEGTLLWGYTPRRDSRHVYLSEGKICLVVYSGLTNQGELLKNSNIITQAKKSTWLYGDLFTLVPTKRLYPEACNYLFCQLLIDRDFYLPFTTWDDEREPRKFHGAIL